MKKPSKLKIILVSILLFPISLPYWWAWSFIEMMREDDGTVWSKNPLDLY
jgi:hypothetical protein